MGGQPQILADNHQSNQPSNRTPRLEGAWLQPCHHHHQHQTASAAEVRLAVSATPQSPVPGTPPLAHKIVPADTHHETRPNSSKPKLKSSSSTSHAHSSPAPSPASSATSVPSSSSSPLSTTASRSSNTPAFASRTSASSNPPQNIRSSTSPPARPPSPDTVPSPGRTAASLAKRPHRSPPYFKFTVELVSTLAPPCVPITVTT